MSISVGSHLALSTETSSLLRHIHAGTMKACVCGQNAISHIRNSCHFILCSNCFPSNLIDCGLRSCHRELGVLQFVFLRLHRKQQTLRTVGGVFAFGLFLSVSLCVLNLSVCVL